MQEDQFRTIKIHITKEKVIRRTTKVAQIKKNAVRCHLAREANES